MNSIGRVQVLNQYITQLFFILGFFRRFATERPTTEGTHIYDIVYNFHRYNKTCIFAPARYYVYRGQSYGNCVGRSFVALRWVVPESWGFVEIARRRSVLLDVCSLWKLKAFLAYTLLDESAR